jgi:apoptosis-inducing factor 3
MDDAAWSRAARTVDLEEGVPLVAATGDRKVLLVKRGGTVHAVGHLCPHYDEKLEKGVVLGSEIVCKSHLARFDLATGRRAGPPALDDLPVYPVRIVDGEVWVGPAAEPPAGPPPARGRDQRLFLVIGGGAAGSAAAETLRRAGFGGRVVLAMRDREPPYDRPALSKGFLTGKRGEKDLPLHGPDFWAARGVEVLTGRTLASLDPARHQARFADGRAIRFDAALVATGGAPRRLPVRGADGEGCLLLRTADEARQLAVFAQRYGSVVLVGGGFIGLELAGTLRDRGLEVTVITRDELPLARVLGEQVARHVRSLFEAKGVAIVVGEPSRIDGPRGAKSVTLQGGTVVRGGFVVTGVGIQPSVGALAGSGLVAEGAIPVDTRMRTRAPGVWAAGDVAAVEGPGGERRRTEHWVTAQRQGTRAALDMLGADPGPEEPGFFWSKLAGVSLKYAGWPGGYDRAAIRGSVEDSRFIAGYYRGGRLVAAAAMGMARELACLERLLARDTGLTVEQLCDDGWDPIAAAQRGDFS